MVGFPAAGMVMACLGLTALLRDFGLLIATESIGVAFACESGDHHSLLGVLFLGGGFMSTQLMRLCVTGGASLANKEVCVHEHSVGRT